MTEEEKNGSKSKSIIIILIIVIVMLLVGGAVVITILLQNNSAPAAGSVQSSTETSVITSTQNNELPILNYDKSAIALNEEDLEKQNDDALDKVDDGQVSLEFQNIAFSDNGTDFTCYLANSTSNNEDMYFNIYKDGTFSEQIYLSGLLPPGKVIEAFHSEIKFDPGKYEVVVLFTTVANDHKTITSQTPVVITLEVA